MIAYLGEAVGDEGVPLGRIPVAYLDNLCGPRRGVAGFDEGAGDTLHHRVDDAVDARGEQAPPQRGRLDGGQAEAIASLLQAGAIP